MTSTVYAEIAPYDIHTITSPHQRLISVILLREDKILVMGKDTSRSICSIKNETQVDELVVPIFSLCPMTPCIKSTKE